MTSTAYESHLIVGMRLEESTPARITGSERDGKPDSL
jgi:hypothetical protein